MRNWDDTTDGIVHELRRQVELAFKDTQEILGKAEPRIPGSLQEYLPRFLNGEHTAESIVSTFGTDMLVAESETRRALDILEAAGEVVHHHTEGQKGPSIAHRRLQPDWVSGLGLGGKK